LAVGEFPDGITNSGVCYCNDRPLFSLIVLMIVEHRKINRGAWRASAFGID
jgi:hypothetical protein